jgi:hypothetical protein
MHDAEGGLPTTIDDLVEGARAAGATDWRGIVQLVIERLYAGRPEDRTIDVAGHQVAGHGRVVPEKPMLDLTPILADLGYKPDPEHPALWHRREGRSVDAARATHRPRVRLRHLGYSPHLPGERRP